MAQATTETIAELSRHGKLVDHTIDADGGCVDNQLVKFEDGTTEVLTPAQIKEYIETIGEVKAGAEPETETGKCEASCNTGAKDEEAATVVTPPTPPLVDNTRDNDPDYVPGSPESPGSPVKATVGGNCSSPLRRSKRLASRSEDAGKEEGQSAEKIAKTDGAVDVDAVVATAVAADPVVVPADTSEAK